MILGGVKSTSHINLFKDNLSFSVETLGNIGKESFLEKLSPKYEAIKHTAKAGKEKREDKFFVMNLRKYLALGDEQESS